MTDEEKAEVRKIVGEAVAGAIKEVMAHSNPRFQMVDGRKVYKSPDCCGCTSFPYALCGVCARLNGW